MSSDRIETILEFWFGKLENVSSLPEEKARLWFSVNPEFDREIRSRFQGDFDAACLGEYDSWTLTPRGLLALVILLDQFSRNLYRDRAEAFDQDERALELAQKAVARGDDKALKPLEAVFLYLPFEHAEDPALQERSVALFTALAEAVPPAVEMYFRTVLDYAIRHRDIVARFGRFPHRNAVLRRPTTNAELEFLKQPGSSF